MSRHSPDQSPVRPVADRTVEGGSASARVGDGPPRPGIEQLRDVVTEAAEALRRRSVVFRNVFLATAAVLVGAILLQTPLYESTSLMLVKFGRELVYTPEIGQERSIVSQDKAAVINSELAILRSQPVLEGVVRDIGVSVLYPSLAEASGVPAAGDPAAGSATPEYALAVAEAAERLRLSLSTLALPEADVIQVSFQHPDPLVAARTVNSVVERFLDAHLSAFAAPEIVRFLEDRVQSYEEQLAESEQTLREFETEHPAFALDNPQTVLVTRRDETRTALVAIQDQMSTIRLRHLQEDASVAQARNQLLTLEVESSRLEGRLQRETQQQIDVVKRFIAQRKAEVERELGALATRRNELEAELTGIQTELEQMPTLSAEYRRLVRERDGDEEQYRTYAKRLRDARLSGEMDRERIASINVIQPASPAPRPAWPPSKGLSSVIAVFLAALAALLVVILLERIGPTGIAWLDASSAPGRGAPGSKQAAG